MLVAPRYGEAERCDLSSATPCGIQRSCQEIGHILQSRVTFVDDTEDWHTPQQA